MIATPVGKAAFGPPLDPNPNDATAGWPRAGYFPRPVRVALLGLEAGVVIDAAIVAGALWLAARRLRALAGSTLETPVAVLIGATAIVATADAAVRLSAAGGDVELATGFMRVSVLGTVVLVLGIFHLALVYPRPVAWPHTRALLASAYVSAILLVVLAPTPLVIARVEPVSGGFHTEPGPLNGVVALFETAAVLAAAVWLGYVAAHARSGLERRVGAGLCLAIVVPMVISGITAAAGSSETDMNDVFTLAFGWWLLLNAVLLTRNPLPPPLTVTFDAVLKTASHAILVIDTEGRVVLSNPACRDILGVGQAARGQPLDVLLLKAMPDQAGRERAERAVKDVMDGALESQLAQIREVGPLKLTCKMEVLPLGPRSGDRRTGAVLVSLTDITKEAAAEQANAATRQLQELSIRILGHDLKSPLTAVQGSLELAEFRLAKRAKDADAKAALKDLRRVREATAGMLVVLENARAISRITGEGGAQPRPAAVDFSAMVKQSIERLRPIAEGKELQLRAEIDAGVRAKVIAGFESVPQNLVANGIKYVPKGGEVGVRLTGAPGANVVLEVWDDGPGIPKADRGRLFQAFQRLEPARGVEGHGLGLAIVSKMVELCSGTVEALDRPDGKPGAFFRVVLPPAGPTSP